MSEPKESISTEEKSESMIVSEDFEDKDLDKDLENDLDDINSGKSLLHKRKSLEPDNGPQRKKQRRMITTSNILDILDKNQEYVAGIDEAGRGPVLGAMVYAIAFYPFKDNDSKLRKIGFNDSKQLTEAQRDNLFEKIHENDVGFIADPLSAEYLSTEMLKIERRNLNRISHDTAISLIGRVLKHGFKIKALYVDTVGKPETYEKILKDQYSSIETIIVCKKADSIYPIVGAASICAKVIRDRLLNDWNFKEKIPFTYRFGSGYPGDQVTKDWLEENRDSVFGYPSLVRYSWSTTTNCLQDAVEVYWSFEDMQAYQELMEHTRMSQEKQELLRDASNRARKHKENLKKLQKRYNYFSASGMGRMEGEF